MLARKRFLAVELAVYFNTLSLGFKTFTIGIDCEMVKSTDLVDVLAKVAIVTDEKILLNTFVTTEHEVLDYGTDVSGVCAEDLIAAPHIDSVIPLVRNILNEASIIVGHGLEHDMEVLGINFPADKVRDTAHYRPFLKHGGRSSKLKYLARKHLGKLIQTGEHDPIEDAKAALFLYYKMMNPWEEMIRNKLGAREIIENFKQNNFTSPNRFEILNNIDENGSEMSCTGDVFLSRRGEPVNVSSEDEWLSLSDDDECPSLNDDDECPSLSDLTDTRELREESRTI